MLTLRHATKSLIALAALSLTAYAQQPQPSPGQAPASQSSQVTSPTTTTTTTTTTNRPAASPDLNTDTNSQPDITGTSGHPDTDVRIRPGIGTLASAMANFSVRTGLEIRPNTLAQVVVQSVRPETPAARAGVEPGDLITNVNGTEISTISSLQKLITKHPSQGAYFVSFRRGEHDFRVPLGRQLSLMGMTLFPDPADRPIVKAVEQGSPAELAGFRVGDVITGVDRQDTSTMAKLLDFAIPFIRNLSQGQGIPFRVIRGGKPVHFSVTRPADADLPLLTPDQERHLRRLANGDEDRQRRERPRSIKSVRSTTQTSGGQTINSANSQQPNAAGFGAAGMGGFGGVVGDGFGGVPGVGTTGTGLGATGTQNVNAAVAVLRATPSTLNQQTVNPAQQTGNSGAAATAGSGSGVVGFVQVQANIGLNGNNGMPSNINPAAPGASPMTGNTTTNTGVNPLTGNAATSTQNPSAAATPTPSLPQQQAQPQTKNTGVTGFGNNTLGLGGIGNGANATNGINGTTNAANGTANGTTGTNGMNGTNNGVNGTGSTPTQSFVSARLSGLAAGTYTLTVNQFGDCGDIAGAAPGPAVLTLGTVVVSANGQGSLPTQTINFAPQVFVGRTVSLVSAGGAAVVGFRGGQSQTAQPAPQASGIVACGRFTAAGSQGNPFIGGGQGGLGVGTTGTGTATGTTTGTGTTGTGTGTSPTQPLNPTAPGTTGQGTGTGTLPKVPGQLPRPMFP
jgi:hypothetical protein